MGWRLKANYKPKKSDDKSSEKVISSWSLYQITDKGIDKKSGKKIRPARAIERKELIEHGFNPDWSYSEASRFYKETFQAYQKIKFDSDRKARAKSRVNKASLYKSAFLPDPLVREFYQYLHDRFADPTLGTLPDNYESFWRGAQDLIAEVGVDPSDYSLYPNKIYGYAVKHTYSPSWFKKVLKFVNLWGYFVCKKREKAFLPVPPISGQWRNKINEAYLAVKKDGVESDPLSFEIINDIEYTEDDEESEKMKGRHWRYLYTCLAYGLRPSELDRIITDTNNRYHEVTRPDQNGIRFLRVYQPKLINIESSKRWKSIPILYSEQEQALEYIKARNVKRPLTKTIHNFIGARYNNYAGRKGFMDWMLSRAQRFENISMYLGHTSLDRSLRSYKAKGIVYYDLPEAAQKNLKTLKSA